MLKISYQLLNNKFKKTENETYINYFNIKYHHVLL